MSFRKRYERLKHKFESQPDLVGEALFVIRDHQGDTVEEAAKKCGIDAQLLRDVEEGKAPTEAIEQVLKGYNIPTVMAAISQVNTLLASYGAGIKLIKQSAAISSIQLPSIASPENVLDNIPIILKAVRIHRGISQVTLVRKMNEISSCEPPITQGYISKLETGKVPIVLDKITLFTDALGCPKEADNLAWLIEQFQIQQKAEAASRSKNNI